MFIAAIDDNIALFELIGIKRDKAVSRILDERRHIDDAFIELVGEERIARRTNLRDRLHAAI